MFINISDRKEAANKGSSGKLVHYLEKENRLNKKSVPEYWFNGREVMIDPYTVMQKIDGNIAKLGKADAKFYLINISPSQKELAFLRKQHGDDGIKEQLKGFAVRVMDAYAQNFKREGINSHEDLVWFAKLENYRYYTFNDREVKDGAKKRGDRKEGEQMHIQVIVSRKDVTNTIKLSPMNTSRGKNEQHSKKMGQFDRVAFKQSGETLFDSLFEFDRGLKETMAYANAQKNGSLEDRVKMATLERESVELSAGNERHKAPGQDQAASLAPTLDGAVPVGIGIADDVDDEAVYGRNRRKYKSQRR